MCFCCYYSILSTVLGEGTFIPLWWIGLLGFGSCAFLPHLCIKQNPQNFKNLQKLISTMCLFLLAKNKTNSSVLDSSIFSPFFCGTNIQIQCSSWHKKLQLFFGLLTRTNQTNLVSLGLFCLAGNTWTKIQCPFEGKDKLCLDWHKKLQLLFGFLFMRFLCHFCLAQKIRQTWPLTFGRKKLDVLLTENN